MPSPEFQFSISGYGCVRNLVLPLRGIHALVGPNDSGKSTVLRAVRTVMQFAGDIMPGNAELAFDPMLVPGHGSTLTVVADGYEYKLSWDGRETTDELGGDKGIRSGPQKRMWDSGGVLHAHDTRDYARARELFRPASFVHLSPEALRRPSGLIPDHERIRLNGESGHGLAGIYDRIASRSIDDYVQIQKDVRGKFSHVRDVALSNLPLPNRQTGKALATKLVDGTTVPAQAISEGLLYYLAFAALRYLERPSVLLVEEPENGLHPARIAEVVRALREYSEQTPVLMATHSPLVINELKGDEVSIVKRTPSEGTTLTLVQDTPNFAERSRIYALGELWVSYADGVDEGPLFEEPIEAEDPGPAVELGEPGE